MAFKVVAMRPRSVVNRDVLSKVTLAQPAAV